MVIEDKLTDILEFSKDDFKSKDKDIQSFVGYSKAWSVTK